MPDNSLEKDIEPHAFIKEFLLKTKTPRADTREVLKEFHELLRGDVTIERLESEWKEASGKCQVICEDVENGDEYANGLLTKLWRRMAIIKVVINIKKEGKQLKP